MPAQCRTQLDPDVGTWVEPVSAKVHSPNPAHYVASSRQGAKASAGRGRGRRVLFFFWNLPQRGRGGAWGGGGAGLRGPGFLF